METTADLDENNKPKSLHHKIVHISSCGPVGSHGILRLGDEILEVNSCVLQGLPHTEAIAVIRDTPPVVRFVVSRPIGLSTPPEPNDDVVEDEVSGAGGDEDATSGGVDAAEAYPGVTLTLAIDSDDDPILWDEVDAPVQSTAHPLPSVDYLEGDFTRRLERQSWRERHEEERRRLKQKFEVR